VDKLAPLQHSEYRFEYIVNRLLSNKGLPHQVPWKIVAEFASAYQKALRLIKQSDFKVKSFKIRCLE